MTFEVLPNRLTTAEDMLGAARATASAISASITPYSIVVTPLFRFLFILPLGLFQPRLSAARAFPATVECVRSYPAAIAAQLLEGAQVFAADWLQLNRGSERRDF